MTSLTGEEIIKKAKLAYSLDMISEQTLNYVAKRVDTDPSYTGVLELPLDWEISREVDLRRKADRVGRSRLWRLIYRWVL